MNSIDIIKSISDWYYFQDTRGMPSFKKPKTDKFLCYYGNKEGSFVQRFDHMALPLGPAIRLIEDEEGYWENGQWEDLI